MSVSEMHKQSINTATDCVASLFLAVDQAGGRVDQHMLDMSLRDFLAHVAAPNGVRFVCVKEPKETIDEDDLFESLGE